MSDLQRFGVTVPKKLLQEYDQMIEEKGYSNRSEAIRDLIREKIVEEAWRQRSATEKVAGTIAIVYDHHTSGLSAELTSLQHEYFEIIMATVHIHLDSNNCLEVLVLKGTADEIHQLDDRITCLRGIKHSKLTLSTTGANII